MTTALATRTKSTAPTRIDIVALDAEVHELARRTNQIFAFCYGRPLDTRGDVEAAERTLAEIEPDPDHIAAVRAAMAEGLAPASRQEISQHLALLIGAFPTPVQASDPAVYSRMMVEDCVAARPSRLAIESACTKLRRTLKWPPAISEVLEMLADEQRFWSVWAGRLPDYAEQHRKAVEGVRRQRERIEQFGRRW